MRLLQISLINIWLTNSQSWLVVSTPLKNISELGWLFPIYGKIKKCTKAPARIPSHQLNHSRFAIMKIPQWPFQEPKLEVPTIYKAYIIGLCKGISQQNMALYLHFWILEFPLNSGCFFWLLRQLPRVIRLSWLRRSHSMHFELHNDTFCLINCLGTWLRSTKKYGGFGINGPST